MGLRRQAGYNWASGKDGWVVRTGLRHFAQTLDVLSSEDEHILSLPSSRLDERDGLRDRVHLSQVAAIGSPVMRLHQQLVAESVSRHIFC